MADYNPPREDIPIFNNNEFRPVTGGGGLTEAEADLLYLKFPVAQGPETLGIITVTDTATFNGLVEVNQTLDASNIETVNLDVELDATINNLDNTNLDTSYGIVNKVVSNEIIGIGNIISTYPNIRTVWYVQDYDPGTGDPTTPAVIASEIDTTLYRVRGLKFSAAGSLVSTSNWFTYTPQVNIDKYFGFIINPGISTADIPILTNWDPITGLSTSTFYVPVGGIWDNTQYQDFSPFNTYEQYLTAETATRRFIVSPPNDDTLSITSKGGSITMGTYNNLPQASTVSSGIVQLTDSYVSPSLTEAPTANALADAYIDLDDKITINRKDIDSLERVTQIQVPQSFDYSIGSGGDFADLQTALASSNVKNGTILRIIAGTTINILSTLTITKQVTIYGDNRDTCIIRNDPSVTNMVTLLSCQADYVMFNNLTINFTSSISDNFALIFTSASGGNIKNPIVANCKVVYNKFGIVERGENFIVDNVLFQTQGTASTRRAVSIYRSFGNCFVSNCNFNQTIDTNNRLIHILETSINDTKIGTHNFINNRSTGLCFQFVNYESFRGITDGLSIIARGNTMNETSAFLVLFNTTLNNGNTVKDVYIQNNTFTNRHTPTPPNGGKGCLAMDTSVVFKSVSLPVYSFNNIATVDQTFRAGWLLAQDADGVNVGITTAGNTAYTTAGFNPVAFNDVEVSVLALPPVPSEFNSDDNRLRVLETNASGGSFLPLSGGELTGNLGILKAPTVPLDVLGNASISGSITAGSYVGLPAASTSVAGIVQLNDTVSSTSTTQAGTANSVKTANDNANTRVLKSGDTMTGNLIVPTITSIASSTTNASSTVSTSSEQLVGQKDICHNDILPIGTLSTGPFSGLVNSVIAVQAYDINGDPTNTWGFVCLEYQNLTTKNTVRGVLYNTNGTFQSASNWFNISTNSGFDEYYGRFVPASPNNPIFCLDYNSSTNTTRGLIFISEFGSFTWDNSPILDLANPLVVGYTNESQYVNNSNLNKRALGNKYTNSLSFYNKDATIVTDSISASTYNNLPSLPYLPLSGGSLSGTLDGTNCEMLTYLGAEYQVKSLSGQPYLAGITSDFTTGVMNVYANDNMNGAINQVIKNVTVGQWNDGGLKLLSNNGNTTLRLESGANQQSRINFGDSTTNNRGRIHYSNNTNTLDIHVNNDNNARVAISPTTTIIRGDALNIQDNSGATDRLVILSNTNVGIGTNNPQRKLHVEGSSIRLSNAGSATLEIWDTSSSNVSPFRISQNKSLETFGLACPSSTMNMTFNTANLERMRIDNTGNVGIGLVNPGYRLHVYGGDTRIQRPTKTSLDIYDNSASNPSPFTLYQDRLGLTQGLYSASNIIDTVITTNNTERLRVLSSNGNVGINQSLPQTTLHTKGRIRVEALNNVDSAGVIELQNFGGQLSYFFEDSSGNVILDTASNRFGIERTPTTYALEVSGNAGKTVGGTTWVDLSDERIKTDIQDADLDILYDNIKNTKLHYYKKIEKYSPTEIDRHQIGIIAQELEESGIYPKAVQISPLEKFKVGEDEEGNDIYEEIENFRWVNYDQLYKANLGATQKLIKKVEEQETIIQQQNQRITNLETLLLNVVQRFNALDDNDEDIVV